MFCNLMVGLITIALLFVQDIHWLLVALMIRSILLFSYPAQQTLTRQIVSPDLLTSSKRNSRAGYQDSRPIGACC